MSQENKQNEKVKSTLSADVPPFVPRNCNLGLLNNAVPVVNEITHIPHYIHVTAQGRQSKWHLPVPSTSSGIVMLPVTPYMPPDYQPQSSSQRDGFILPASHSQLINNRFCSQGKESHNQKYLKRRSVVAVNEISVSNESNSYAPSESEVKKRQKEVSSYLNSKIKVNHKEDNIGRHKSQIKLLTANKTLKWSVKLDNNVEFPSLPTVPNKDNLHDQLGNSETSHSTQHSSYSSILQSTPKHLSETNEMQVLSNSDNHMLVKSREESDHQQNVRRKQKTKRKFETKNKQSMHCECDRKNDIITENEQNNLKGIRNQKNNKYQTSEEKAAELKQTNNTADDFMLKRNKSPQKKYFGNSMENTQVPNTNDKSVALSNEEKNVTVQIVKPEKSGNKKRKRHNKKKKKVDPGKVSLLSPEVFAAITNRLNEVSNLNQTDNFNLCDQQDFPSLGPSSSLTAAVERTEPEKFNMEGLKRNKISLINSKSEKPLHSNFTNVWKPTTYSDILQTANKIKNSEKEIQANINSVNKNSNEPKKEGIPVTVSNKKEKKKKKKSSATSGSSKKLQADSEKKVKSDSVIQISIASMVTSLQHVKLNQPKKKEIKTRVISTKKGIMGKMANQHNMLDSSAPMKRGKEREKPCRRRLSAMRKIILREREKRRNQFLEAARFKSEDEDNAENSTDDINGDVTPPQSQSFSDTHEQVDNKLKASKIILHTKKFRDYCDHMISEEIDSTVMTILKDLVRFQDRLHEKDPIKARMKRRLVYGLREVTKHLRLCKLKCIIIAPNIEKISSEGGLSDALQIIIKFAQDQGVPYIFALQRRALGKVCMKIVPISCVGIFNYEGAEVNYYKLLEFLTEAREKYNETLKIISTYITEDIEAKLLQTDVLPAAVQPIRSDVLSKISVHSTIGEGIPSMESGVENEEEESNTEQDIVDTIQRMENISVRTE